MGCPTGYGSGAHHWGGSMMQATRGDDGRRVMMVHMWPLALMAWMLFMLGVMVGAKKSMMMERMGGMGMHGMSGMGGMGMHGMGGMRMGMHGMGAHHHHGTQAPPCCCGQSGEEGQEPEQQPS